MALSELTVPSPESVRTLIDARGELRLRVIAGARVEKAAIVNGALKLWLRTAPENGKANTAILKMLAEMLSVPQTSLEIVHGQSSRDKRIRVTA